MICLVHNPRYRSLFHAVVNELRNEKRISVNLLRNMPKSCCTCNNIDNVVIKSCLIHDKDKLINLQKLINQINQDKHNNPKLILALNGLENFINENQVNSFSNPLPITHTQSSIEFSDSEDSQPMNTDRSLVKKQKNPPKPLKDGTFLFLPYNFDNKSNSIPVLKADKDKQRGRFIGRNGYITSLEKQKSVCINMITPSTSEQIKRTLSYAKEQVGNVKIHNPKDISKSDDGEWILVRMDKTKTNTGNIEDVLDDLNDRWESFLKIRKRRHIEVDEEDDEESFKKI
ncbi:unnamed protein product [Adineta steineri]|uniref:K Homology domain-containing protein n=1 Tax=Adineta steineri TaxID=433720 RepID=A0A815FL39_9BILA|nr:unnamed protein product [Adineta steineri]CAF3761904.1 unnamed protein product [Adineta steineri]